MSLLFDSSHGPVDFVLHPTDLSEASERAFHHALALAVREGAQFTLLHAIGRRSTDNWVDFPSVRSKLDEWRAAGGLAGVGEKSKRASVSKIEVDIRDPVAACMKYIDRHPVNMIVLATEGRSPLSRLLRAPRAERLARESRILTLFVPFDGRHFVAPESGRVSLRRILVPVDPNTDPRPAMLYAVRAAALLDDPELEITLLHVGGEEAERITDVPELPFCRWNVEQKSGDVVEEILAMARELETDAIYMTTAWTKGGLGTAEGTVTERVLANAPCPLVAVPVSR